jgi:hypothetical protein
MDIDMAESLRFLSQPCRKAVRGAAAPDVWNLDPAQDGGGGQGEFPRLGTVGLADARHAVC